MATRKQKHQAAVEKHNREMEQLRLEGLTLLNKDRQHRRQQELDDWRENHTKNHSWKKRITECPHCRMELAALNRQLAEAEAAKKQPTEVLFLSPAH